MPYFIVHQPIILALAYYIVTWHTNLWLKYAVLLPTAFAASALLAWLLSSTPVINQFFGVKRTPDVPKNR